MLATILLSFGGVFVPAATPPTLRAPSVQTPEAESTAYADALAAFEKAKEDWQTKIRETEDAAQRRELRRNHPALAFKERFESLVASGEGRALLWLVENQRYLNIPKEQREQQAMEQYGRLLNDFGQKAWYLSAMESVARDRQLEPLQRVALLKRVLAKEAAPEIHRIAAKFYAGELLLESKDDGNRSMGRQMLKEVLADHPKSEFAVRARVIVETVDVSVGAMAPDFIGTSVDKETIRLSDFKGKVVVLDFFGFW